VAARWVKSGARAALGGALALAVGTVPSLVPPSRPVPSPRAAVARTGATAAAPAGGATGAPAAAAPLGPWQPAGNYLVPSFLADEGVASLSEPNGQQRIVYRGDLSVPAALRRQGWAHIGDPGGFGGYVVDALQAVPAAAKKLFRVTAPSGRAYNFVHDLVPGEQYNNSFAAISPDDAWLVSGGWGEQRRLLVYPSPVAMVESGQTTKGLPLAFSITLDRPVRDVQGCTFLSATQLLCSTDDRTASLWPTPYQLLEVTLPAPLAGAAVIAEVTSLGQLPRHSSCRGTFEVEGIDYQTATGLLRVEVVPPGPCGLLTEVYEYRDLSSPGAGVARRP
jgi:hypothetical protein